MRTSTGAKLFVVTTIVSLVGALAFVLGVYAQVKPGTVNACVPSGTTGAPRTMAYNTTGSCPNNQELITWNVQGPAGPAGPQGPAGAGAATMKTTLVLKSSNQDKKATHSALVFCPAGWSLLYGGADLAGDARSKVITINRPAVLRVPSGHARAAADPIAPSGWFVRATKDYAYSERLRRMAKAIQNLAIGDYLGRRATELEHGAFDEGIGGYSDEAVANFTRARDWAEGSSEGDALARWSVQAWAMCGMPS